MQIQGSPQKKRWLGGDVNHRSPRGLARRPRLQSSACRRERLMQRPRPAKEVACHASLCLCMPCKPFLRAGALQRVINLHDRQRGRKAALSEVPAHSGRWPLTSRRGPRAAGAARRGSAPPCHAPRPNDACTSEGGFLPPRARPRARGRVFAPSPTLLGPFAPQRVAAAHRGDVAEGFEASCCLPLAMTVRACTCTCDCTATVAPTSVGEQWAPKALHRRLADALNPRQPWRRAASAPPQRLAPGSATLHAALMQVSNSRPPSHG